LTSLAEHYGVPADEEVRDAEWLELAGRNGWVVFMKDARIRYNPAERKAVKTYRVRCFCLSNRHLNGVEMAGRFLDNLTRITVACSQKGPFVYTVHKNRIERLELGST
jgi:hypothetical protein